MDPRSPKRKREHDTMILAIQTQDINPIQASKFHPQDLNDEDEFSPRTTMARKFQKLDIQQHPFHHMTTATKPHNSDNSMKKADLDVIPESIRRQDTVVTGTGNAPSQSLSLSSSEEQPPTMSAFTFEAAIDRPDRMNVRSTTPPLSESISDQFWSEDEITGFDPNDPQDDGYGINGIGYKPTPAMAFARSQKRKQQLLEYRYREAKEARQRRSNRRRHANSIDSTDEAVGVNADHESGPQKVARVHFDVG